MSAELPGWAELRADAKAGLGDAPDLGPILAPLLAARSPAEGLACMLSRLPRPIGCPPSGCAPSPWPPMPPIRTRWRRASPIWRPSTG
ncbi:hypothetical protein GT370_10780 [Acidocella sp. MX-AZ03]|uniref:hypothetical protein n=1 Tax=Acidocella sp. MX-AZ03 TaxID=2697363 RepID=UPI0022DDD809|nr:hypothetical protein [Acidocella sp. MX-AZ03]WBO57800.1 hypothetical protein GT370_10780 [Acidocella sp. MX-AZ03]